LLIKSSSLKFICLSLIMLAVCASADARPKRTGAAIPPNIHARIIQLEDERNLNGDELTGLLKHASAAVRERAALAIGRIGDKRGTDALIAMLEHEGSEPARAMAAFALGEMEDARGVSALMAVVEREEESLSVRARAVESLGKIAGVQANADTLGKTAVERINQSLIAQLPGSQTSLERKPLTSLTIAALMRIRSPASVEPLTRQLKSKDAEIRAQSANALARLRQPIDGAVPALIEALNDSDADVRANAARALGASKDARAVAPLLKLLDDESERAEVNAVRALAALGDQRATGPLIELGEGLMWGPPYMRRKDDETLNLLLEVATALGTIKGESAWVFLAQLHHAFAPKSVQEVEVAMAKFADREFSEATTGFADQRDTFCRDWKRATAAALAISEWLPTKDERVWQRAWYELLYVVMPGINSPACDQRSRPEALRAVNKLSLNFLAEPSFAQSLKPKDVATSDTQIDFYLSFFPSQLEEKDVIVRATAANILAEQPREAHLAPLVAALARSKNDPANDARLAILTAISKHKKPEAVEAVKSALADHDHLVRRHAVDLLKQMGAGDFSDRIGVVQTGHDKRFYQRVAARLDKKVTATIHTAKGRIRIELFTQDAPITVDSFVMLARRGFFNGLTFHRVVPNFVIQGGDPRGDGEGGPSYQIRCEINTQPYARGAVGMALSGKDTGGSQFFITHSPQPHLDGGYTVFGQVVVGMKVVDRIARGDMIRRVEIFESR
jgi:cyclophilin family peptidyl-prolyl cis-trans isomerase/HEAT repeat protein